MMIGDGIEKTCVCLCKTWNLTSLVMEVNFFWKASCLAMCSTSWVHQSRFIFVGPMARLHMHQERPWIVGWGRLNLVHNVKEKMSKAFLKDGMARWIESQAPKPNLHKISTKQDNNMKTTKMMLKNESSCTLFEMFSQRWSIAIFDSYSNGGMIAWIVGGRRSWTCLRWTWNGSGFKLLAFIAPIKMDGRFTKLWMQWLGRQAPNSSIMLLGWFFSQRQNLSHL